MDGAPEGVDPEVLLFAPTVFVAATFPNPEANTDI